jgi:hypothetical protein
MSTVDTFTNSLLSDILRYLMSDTYSEIEKGGGNMNSTAKPCYISVFREPHQGWHQTLVTVTKTIEIPNDAVSGDVLILLDEIHCVLSHRVWDLQTSPPTLRAFSLRSCAGQSKYLADFLAAGWEKMESVE